MGMPSIIRALGVGLIFLGLAMILPAIYAVTRAEQIAPWVFGATATILFGTGLYLSTGSKRPATDFRGGILLVLLWWLISPLFAALPFILNGTGFSNAYFESVSALTTTGAWLSLEDILADKIGLLWRAMLQWIGGLVSIAFAASVIVRPAFYGLDTLAVPFSRGEQDSYLRSFRNALQTFLLVYSVLTAICFMVLLIEGVDVYSSVIISLSIQASGGLIPHADGLSGYSASLPSLLLPFIFFSGMNYILISLMMRGIWRKSDNIETEVYIFMIFIVGILFWVLAGAGDIKLIPAQLFNATSLLSTNGVILGEAPPATVAIITVLIGGAAVSTAGGFKIQRWLVIMRRAREEIRRLVSPNAVYGSSRIANELGVWMHFLVFTLFLAIMVLVFTFSGYGFEVSTTVAAATLSNAGPVISVIQDGPANYEYFGEFTRWIMVIAMILGRVEAVAALALFNKAFWRA